MNHYTKCTSIRILAVSCLSIKSALILFLFLALPFSATPHPGDSLHLPAKKKGVVIKVDLAAPIVTLLTYKTDPFGKNYLREYLYSFAVEKLLPRQQSLQLTCLSFTYRNKNTGGIPDYIRTWFLLAPEYKYFVSGRRDHQGFYVGANLKYVRSMWQDPFEYAYNAYGVVTGISQHTGASFLMGLQFSGKRGFTFDLLTSVGFITEVSYSLSRSPNTPNIYWFPSFSYFSHIPFDYPLYYTSANTSYMDFRVAINLGYRF